MTRKNEWSFYRWDSMKKERVSDMLERRLITGDRMMLAQVYLKKGCIVPKHSHENEQLTYVLEGCLRFWLGEDQGEVVDVHGHDLPLILTEPEAEAPFQHVGELLVLVRVLRHDAALL